MLEARATDERLAEEGGSPVRVRPFPSWPNFEEDEVDAVVAVLRSGKVNYWTGEEGRKFEQEFAEYVGTNHAVAVANGTVALELALRALDIGPGAEIVVPCRTFIASASCVAMCGAVPVMADVDRESQVLTAETLRKAITPRTRAVVAVHLAGWPCDMDSILPLTGEFGLKVIEDCAQAHGAQYRERPVGSMGDVGAFSFCQDKIMTTGGEGGMLVTSSEALWRRTWSYKDHGKNYDATNRDRNEAGFQWVHDSFGTNWRMTEMQAALGRRMLRKLDDGVACRARHASVLNEALKHIPGLRVTPPPAHVRHSYYKYYAFVRPENLRARWDRDRILGAIQAEGIPCYSGACSEIYLERAFDDIRPERLPVAKELGETSLMFLVHPTLSDGDILDTIAAVRKVMQQAST
jgi:dTDP-4-amino-4,6-dideoxygalactose transaminase